MGCWGFAVSPDVSGQGSGFLRPMCSDSEDGL